MDRVSHAPFLGTRLIDQSNLFRNLLGRLRHRLLSELSRPTFINPPTGRQRCAGSRFQPLPIPTFSKKNLGEASEDLHTPRVSD